MSDKLVNLFVNGLKEPLAIDDPYPAFSWQMVSSRTGARQTAYRIRVYCGEMCCWDSGQVYSEWSACISYPKDAVPLKPESKYRWELTVWDEQGDILESEAAFSTGFMTGDLSAWHGAQWIGPNTLSLMAETVPVFRLEFQMTIRPGGSEAGVIFGANDPRLSASTKNNYLISGENYIAYRLNVTCFPAVVHVCRKGYAPGEEDETLVASLEVPETVIHPGNLYAAHRFSIVICGNQMEEMSVDGVKLDTGREDISFSGYQKRPASKTQLVLNPLNEVINVPIYPRLCEIGFTTAEDTEAVFTDYVIRHYGGEKHIVFGPHTGATYRILEGKPGLTVDDRNIYVSAGTLCYADPSFGAAPMLRKDVAVSEDLVSATFYAAARGIYELTINGQKADDVFLSPGDMDFRKRIVYTASDVTGYLKAGENTLGVILASGWFGDQTSYTAEGYNFYGDRQALLAVLVLRYADGHSEYHASDNTWQCYGEGPVRYAGNFNGEIYDATREEAVKGWDCPGFDATGWQPATILDSKVCGMEPLITAKRDTGIYQVEEREASFVSKEVRGMDQDTVYIYDMGVNMVGIPQITFPVGYKGQKITIRYAEMLYPFLREENPYYYGKLGGLILTENLRGALATDRYIMKGDQDEVFIPRFTFHGYRYLEISGISEPLPAENIKGIVLSSIRPSVRYESSEPLANQLFDNILRSTSGNHLSIPTDCPQRDERLGWAGDANVYAETATYMADMRTFYSNYNELQRDAQGPDGTFNLFAPSLADAGQAFALGYTWNAAGVMIPFECWLQYGDRKELQENYPNFKRHVLGMMDMKMPGKKYLTSHIGFLGDHLAVVPTAPALMDNAQFYRVVRRVQKTAEILGETSDAVQFAAYAEGLRQEWNTVFVDSSHRTRTAEGVLQDTQASYALPLMCDVFSEDNRPYAERYLEESCRKAGYTMTTGFMGTGPLLPSLSQSGFSDCAYRMFEQTTYPSWLYPVINGATSIWERWNSFTIENGFGGMNFMNSFNHYSLGSVGSWMIEYQAGIQRGDLPGFQHFVLQPMPGGHFHFLCAAYDAFPGTIVSEWTAEDGKISSYHAVVPANSRATLYLPVTREQAERIPPMEGVTYKGMELRHHKMTAVFELAAGEFRFAIETVKGS